MAKIKFSDKFAWDTDDLGAYVEQNLDELQTRLVEQSRTVRLMRTLQGIKGTQELPDLDVNLTYQSGTACGFNASGDAPFGKKNIVVDNIKAENSFCNEDLVGFLPQRALAAGASAGNENLPFEQVIVDQLLAKNALGLDKMLWLGDKLSGDATINKTNGLIKEMLADNDILDLNPNTVTSITNSNGLVVVQDAFDVFPAKVSSKENFGMFCGYETFRKVVRNISSEDLNHYKVEDLIEGKKQIIAIEIPGTMSKLYYVPGLNGTSYIAGGLIGANGEFVVGTDQESDWTQVKIWYNEDEEEVRSRLKFRLGVTYRFSSQVGLFTLAAS